MRAGDLTDPAEIVVCAMDLRTMISLRPLQSALTSLPAPFFPCLTLFICLVLCSLVLPFLNGWKVSFFGTAVYLPVSDPGPQTGPDKTIYPYVFIIHAVSYVRSLQHTGWLVQAGCMD